MVYVIIHWRILFKTWRKYFLKNVQPRCWEILTIFPCSQLTWVWFLLLLGVIPMQNKTKQKDLSSIIWNVLFVFIFIFLMEWWYVLSKHVLWQGIIIQWPRKKCIGFLGEFYDPPHILRHFWTSMCSFHSLTWPKLSLNSIDWGLKEKLRKTNLHYVLNCAFWNLFSFKYILLIVGSIMCCWQIKI